MQARAALDRAYDLLDAHLMGGDWAAGPALAWPEYATLP